MQFALDTPRTQELSRVTRLSGWCVDDNDSRLLEVILAIDGRDIVSLSTTYRHDVGEAFKDRKYALTSGFVGDLILPQWVDIGVGVRVSLTAVFQNGRKQFFSRNFIVNQTPHEFGMRPKDYDLDGILNKALLVNKGVNDDSLNRNSASWYLSAHHQNSWLTIAGVPHFHKPEDLPMVRILETGPTHPYSQRALDLISELPKSAVFLDFGSGIKSQEQIYRNALYLDAVHFANVDVVNTLANLPFNDESFDLVVSQAVFEHVSSPFEMADEIFRVLKPGGKLIIDTAFMQPLHGDPSHYFNMTLSALRLLLQKFEIIEDGIQPHQYPSFGLMMQIESVLPLIKPGLWKDEFLRILNELKNSGNQLDEDLGYLGREIIAAGVYAIGMKPL